MAGCNGSGWLFAVVASFFLLSLPGVSSAAEEPEEGFHTTPHVGFSEGPHHVDLKVDFRYRWEDWKAFADDAEDFHGLRTRVALDYAYKDLLRVFAQGQGTAVLGLGSDASGAGGLYRANNDGKNNPSSFRLSQAFLQLGLWDDSWIRFGRQFTKMGTVVKYPEANWKFLKIKRLSQRLIGTVGWTHGERAYDGIESRVALDGHVVHLFAAEPTTGVFKLDSDAYKRQKEVVVGGIDWTAPRGRLFENSELRAFFIGYSDDRDAAKVAGLHGDIELYTMGGSWLGVYPLGPGRVDMLLFGALQVGDYHDLDSTGAVKERDQLAGMLLAEAGYQLPDVWASPWLRLGVNWGSGDDNPDDGDRNTFFNILPTNHLYYGYADQFALQNLIDLLVQFKFTPHERVGVELTYHRFWLQEDEDFRWAGTGAFQRKNLGYVAGATNGSHDVGHELDITVGVKVHEHVKLSGGFARLWGGDVYDGQARQNALFGYLQVAVNY